MGSGAVTQVELIRALVAQWRTEAAFRSHTLYGEPFQTMIIATANTLTRCARDVEQALDPNALSAQPCGCDPGENYRCAQHAEQETP